MSNQSRSAAEHAYRTVSGRINLISYRPFRNSDPPAICRLWECHNDVGSIMHPMSVMLFETFVLAKPYFDRAGITVAVDDDELVGFVHAGFGPNKAQDAISTDTGIICMLVVKNHPERKEIQRELIVRSESYLRGRGAIDIRAGGAYPNCPFYLGLYGGSELPGILSADDEGGTAFRRAGYEEIQRQSIFERQIRSFRGPVDRRLVQHRRKMQVRPILSPPAKSWWEACIYGPTDRIQYVLQPKGGGSVCGTVTFWDMGPISTRRAGPSMGMIDLIIAKDSRRQGLGTYLVCDALSQLASSSVAFIEAQVPNTNEAAVDFLQKLGFEQIEFGVLLEK